MATPLDSLQRASATAAAQHGAISYDQALAAGLSEHQVRRLARIGAWVRVVRGVFVVAGTPDTPRQRAWVAFLATRSNDGVLSHLTAAAFLGLLPFSPLPHVTVRPSASGRCPLAKVHRSPVPGMDRARRDGLTITSVSRTLVDLASLVDRTTLESAVDDAGCRKLVSAASVEAAAGRFGPGRRGIEQLRSVLAVWSERIEPGSVAEVRLLRLLIDLGLTGLVTQHEVLDSHGQFVARLDLAQPAYRRGFEYDGRNPHNPRRWLRDEPRYERLRQLGWDIQPVTKLDLLPGEPRLPEIARRWAVRGAA